MKLTDIVSKSVIDSAIEKSSNVEGLVSILVTVIVGAVVANIFSKKENSGGEKI